MMQRKWTWLLAAMLLGSSAQAWAMESSSLEKFMFWFFSIERVNGVKPVNDKKYLDECGSCHFAYQPGLLPARSWEELLQPEALRKHFGVDAELDDDTRKALLDYAVRNAAETSYYKRSRKIALATAEGPAPLRISGLRYISRKHREIPEKMVKGNAGVKSLSYCDKCHTKAADGVYDEDTVVIPNYPNH